MTSEEAIRAALSMRPDRIGVARLCQELLAQATGHPLRIPSEPITIPIPGYTHIGNKGNPYGRKGKPKITYSRCGAGLLDNCQLHGREKPRGTCPEPVAVQRGETPTVSNIITMGQVNVQADGMKGHDYE